MVIFQGWGALVGVVAAGLLILGLEAIGAGPAISYVIGGLALTAFGFFINAFDTVRHRVFWIPVQYWGVLVVIAGLAGG